MKKFFIVFIFCIANHISAQVPLANYITAEYEKMSVIEQKKVEDLLKLKPQNETDAKAYISKLNSAFEDYDYYYMKATFFQDSTKQLTDRVREKMQRNEENILYFEDEIEKKFAKISKKYGKQKVDVWMKQMLEKNAEISYAKTIRNYEEVLKDIPNLHEKEQNGTKDFVKINYLEFLVYFNRFVLIIDKLKNYSQKDYSTQNKELNSLFEKISGYEDQIFLK